MSIRKVHQDKKGPYVIWDRMKYRGPNTALTKGDEVSVGWANYKDKTAGASITRYKKVQNPGDRYPRNVVDVQERWHTTDSDPRIVERLKQGWTKMLPKVERGTLNVVVAADEGYDYNAFRRNPQGYKAHIARHSTKGINIHLHISGHTSGHVQMTFDQWDELVKSVEAERTTVQVTPIANRLEQELQVEEDLQAYIQEKGLA